MLRPFLLSLLVFAFACGGTEPVSSDALDMAMSTAKANATWNAKQWRGQAEMYANYDILARGDSSQTPKCPQGDGWATVELVERDGKGKLTLKCSTWSGGRNCVDEDHFRGSPAATEDKICQAVGVVLYPIPTIAQ